MVLKLHILLILKTAFLFLCLLQLKQLNFLYQLAPFLIGCKSLGLSRNLILPMKTSLTLGQYLISRSLLSKLTELVAKSCLTDFSFLIIYPMPFSPPPLNHIPRNYSNYFHCHTIKRMDPQNVVFHPAGFEEPILLYLALNRNFLLGLLRLILAILFLLSFL